MELSLVILSVILLEVSYLVAKQVRSPKGASQFKEKIIIDTSVLIDGRIEPIVRSGFVSSELIIPRSVVRELQYMADKADHDKRERARFGLDRIQVLQTLEECTVTIYDDGETHSEGVDEQLIVLAKRLGARLCTVDYNLNKVARVESIKVVNVNELAHALRPAHLPGERVMVEIVQKGQGREQGVGYLDDGTMVVVDNAKKYIGTTVEAEAIRMLQTEAGRMLFAKLLVSPQTEAKVTPAVVAKQQPRSESRTQATQPREQSQSQSQVKPQQQAPSQPQVEQQPQSPQKQAQPRKQYRRRKMSPEDTLIATASRTTEEK